MQKSEKLVDKIFHGLLEMRHEIEEEKIVLYFNPKTNKRNTLDELYSKIEREVKNWLDTL